MQNDARRDRTGPARAGAAAQAAVVPIRKPEKIAELVAREILHDIVQRGLEPGSSPRRRIDLCRGSRAGGAGFAALLQHRGRDRSFCQRFGPQRLNTAKMPQ